MSHTETPLERALRGPGQYDQTTFMGRFTRCIKMMDVTTLFFTSSKREALLQTYLQVKEKRDGWKKISVEDYYYAERNVMTIYHPDTMKPVFWPGRFAAFVPLKLFIYFAMLQPSQQTPMLGFLWQWVNQTYNCMLNYCNRNISKPTNFMEVLQSYFLAVAVSGGIAIGGGKLAPRVSPFVRLFVPFTAVAGANWANLAFVRSSDFMNGVTLRDSETDEKLPGFSRRAGAIGLAQVGFARLFVPLIILVGPPLCLKALFSPRFPFLLARPYLKTPVNASIITFTLLYPSSACLAFYPQYVTLPVESVEQKYHNLKNSKGKKITHVTFNRGL